MLSKASSLQVSQSNWKNWPGPRYEGEVMFSVMYLSLSNDVLKSYLWCHGQEEPGRKSIALHPPTTPNRKLVSEANPCPVPPPWQLTTAHSDWGHAVIFVCDFDLKKWNNYMKVKQKLGKLVFDHVTPV